MYLATAGHGSDVHVHHDHREALAPFISRSSLGAVDVKETETAYEFDVDIPGLTKDEVQVSMRLRSLEVCCRASGCTPLGLNFCWGLSQLRDGTGNCR